MRYSDVKYCNTARYCECDAVAFAPHSLRIRSAFAPHSLRIRSAKKISIFFTYIFQEIFNFLKFCILSIKNCNYYQLVIKLNSNKNT